MSSIFSLISIILVIGAISFFGVRTFSPSVSTTPETQGEDTSIVSAIDSAKDAKQLIESSVGVKSSATLDLSGKGLTKVDMSVFGQTNLEVLDLSHNVLTGALQAEVRHLKNLTTLDLSYNAFTGVPAEVGQLSNLEVLNLSHNKLTGLPYELGNLKSLKLLDISGNEYAEADLAIIKKSLPATTVIKTE